MCGVVGQLAGKFGKILKVSKKPDFNLFSEDTESGSYEEGNKYSVVPGDQCYIVCSDDSESLVIGTFGYMSVDGRGNERWIFNIRVEGFHNKDDKPDYKGPLGIWGNPSVKKNVLEKRCVIPVNFFIEGPKDRKIPRKFLIKRKDEQVFYLAGIYEDLLDKTTGEITKGFVIVTTAYNGITFAVGHHRCPLIISEENAYKWLDLNTPKMELEEFMKPYAANEFIAYEVDPAIAKRNKGGRSTHDSGLIDRIGDDIDSVDI